MRVVVLGAGGFIGRHVLSELLAAGHDVVGIVRSLGNLPAAFPQVTFRQIDLAGAGDVPFWQLQLEGVDAIVNAAGVLRGKQMDAKPALW